MTTTRTIHRQLPVPLTREEKIEFGRQLANLHYQYFETEVAKKAAMDEFKTKLEALDGRMAYAAKVVRDGEEIRDVECWWRYIFETNVKELVRMDTGEIVETAAITAQERQLMLDIAAPDEKPRTQSAGA